MSSHLKLQIEELANGLGKLNPEDVEFASSLLRTALRPNFPIGYCLSPKQAEWVGKLADRVAAAEKPQGPTAQVAPLAGVKALFEKAAKHLKHPAIVLLIGPAMVRIYPARAEGKNPGYIYLKVSETGEYLGKISPEGDYTAARDAQLDAREATPMLVALAANPAAVAAEHGRLTGRCCFCNRALEDERSTAVGYGPVCAGHYELPWGERPAEFAGDVCDGHQDYQDMARREARH